MDASGLIARCEFVKLTDKQSFAGRDGQVRRFQVQGFGFSHWFNNVEQEAYNALPEIGTIGTVVCSMEPSQTTGLFKPVRPTFTVNGATTGSSKPASLSPRSAG